MPLINHSILEGSLFDFYSPIRVFIGSIICGTGFIVTAGSRLRFFDLDRLADFVLRFFFFFFDLLDFLFWQSKSLSPTHFLFYHTNFILLRSFTTCASISISHHIIFNNSLSIHPNFVYQISENST